MIMASDVRRASALSLAYSASQGVWEFISSEEAISIVDASLGAGKSASDACKNLIDVAIQWCAPRLSVVMFPAAGRTTKATIATTSLPLSCDFGHTTERNLLQQDSSSTATSALLFHECPSSSWHRVHNVRSRVLHEHNLCGTDYTLFESVNLTLAGALHLRHPLPFRPS